MNNRRVTSGLLVATLLALPMVSPMIAQGSDHEIAWYGRAKGQRPDTASRIWLMNRNGSNLVWIYETCGWSYPDWAPDGRSLVINQSGFRDVPGFDAVLRLDLPDPPVEPSSACPDDLLPRIADGTGTLAALASNYPYLDGKSYDSVWGAKWSPAGSEIAMLVNGAEFDIDGDGLGTTALVAADPNVLCEPVTGVGVCQQPIPIYHREDADISEFDWSPDGSKILITYDVDDGSGGRPTWVAIIDRVDGQIIEGGGPWSAAALNPPGVADDVADPSWAPIEPPGYIGPVIAFYNDVQIGRKWRSKIFLVDLGSEGSSGQEIGNGTNPSWSNDGEYLAVRGPGDDPQRIDLAGEVIDLAEFWFAWSPDWRPGFQVSECQDYSDCNDGNVCTDDSCVDGECSNPVNSASCDDGNPCTTGDGCVNGRCIGVPIDDDYDQGCVGWCCDGECLPEATQCPICFDRGEPCFWDDECCSGQCHVIKFTCK